MRKTPATDFTNFKFILCNPCNSWLAVFLLMILLPAPIVRAEQKFTLGAQVSYMAGGTNQIANSGLTFFQPQTMLSSFYGLYPSLDLTSVGRRSQLSFSYTAMGDYFNGEQKVTSISHNANANLAFQLGRRTKLTLRSSFWNMPDYASLNVYKGLALTPVGFQFIYEPTLAQRSSQNISGGGGIEFGLTKNSNLTIDLSSYFRNYEKSDLFIGRLSDQTRYEGKLGYSRTLSERRTLSFNYHVVENRYQEYGKVRTHTASISYSQQLTPSMRFSVEAGPSYVIGANQAESYVGYLASAGISRAIRSSQLALNYSHRSGDSTGVGGVSETQSAGLSLQFPFGRRFSFTTSITAYDSRARLDNPYNTRSISGALNLSYSLGRRWSLGVGGSYRKNEGVNTLDNEYERVFVSLAYRAPDLWRFSR